jgi:hypothetical protein
MNCQLSHLLLAFRPNELAADDRAALDAHLCACPACAAHARSSATTDAAFRKAMLAVPVPDGLHARLHAAVGAKQGVTVRRRVAVWGSAALAASIAVALATSLTAHLLRPPLSAEIAGGLLEDERLLKEQRVRDWLKSEGVPGELPEPFDYGQHAVHGVGPLGTMKVPFVMFQNDRGQCRVYVLRASAVRTPAGGWKDAFGSEFNIKAVERGEFVYLIAVSTSTTLDTFLKAPAPVA